jgi:hypothetical protein
MPAVEHMVLVKFKSGVSSQQIAEMFSQLAELPRLVPGIRHFAWGTNSSPEGLGQGYTHGFLMIFESRAARDAYLPHPEHERVKAAIIPWVESVVVFDIEEQPGS